MGLLTLLQLCQAKVFGLRCPGTQFLSKDFVNTEGQKVQGADGVNVWARQGPPARRCRR